MTDKKALSAGQLARCFQNELTLRTLRHYEAIGLVTANPRDRHGRRRYPPDTIAVLRKVTLLKSAGFSLNDIRLILTELAAHPSAGKRSQQAHAGVLHDVREKLRVRMEELTAMVSTLDRALSEGRKCDGCQAGDCAECGQFKEWRSFGFSDSRPAL